MNPIVHNQSLKQFNTFGIDAEAAYYTSCKSVESLVQTLQKRQELNCEMLILGGGSNMLFTQDYKGLVLHNQLKGIEIAQLNEFDYLVSAAAGEVWHNFVQYCIQHNLGGIENLSLIPGFVGASPMQNIGAYGVEIKDVFHSLKALEISTGITHTFSKEECQFGYRESVFKRAKKNQFIITEVTFKLSTKYELNTSYGAIEKELEQMQVAPNLQSVSQAVINIRSSKLPNPKELGNAGSFFKNPTISESLYNELKKKYADLPGYPANDNMIKTAAGYLIEKSGLKGYQIGNVGVHKMQALVLVNYGNATGKEVYELSEKVIQTVKAEFGIELEREVNII